MSVEEQWDLVVVGGGIAGLTAAARSAELGLKVVLLEQGASEKYACNSRLAGGIFHVAYHDVRRPAAELLEIIHSATGNKVSEAQAGALAQDAGRLVDWLQHQGARFMRFSPAEAHRWCLAPPRPLAAGLVWEGRGPDVALGLLAGKLKERGGQIRLNATATALHLDGARCGGVVYTQGGQQVTLRSRAVVIADGGFQADADLFRTHFGSRPDRVLQRGAATGNGAGLRMAVAAGAALSGDNNFYGHLLCRDALVDPQLWPYPEVDAIACAGIVVGANGTRLADESRGGIGMANFLARLDDPASTTAIFDAAIWDGPGTSARFPANPYIEKFGGKVLRANSLAELARKAGLPAEALTQTVVTYNAHVKAGSYGQMVPPRGDAGQPMLIEKLPFMALPLCAGITYTMRGIEIDEHAQVLRPDRSVIQGLFAAGATTGGLEGGGNDGRVGYVGGLIKAVFGLRAAERIKEIGVPAQ